MKTKNILFGLFTFLTIGIYAQTNNNQYEVKTDNNKYEVKTEVNEVKFIFENIGELDNFDWKGIKEGFKSNNADQIINLAFAYNPKIDNELSKTKTKIDHFEFKVSGKSSDIDNIIKKSKKVLEILKKLDKEDKN